MILNSDKDISIIQADYHDVALFVSHDRCPVRYINKTHDIYLKLL